ncbi:MAG TPA: SDR family oxidoreductase [Xanthomonadales bacterium]|nr:SDR family oxidoreductase [Xanthomonadales bacterium]
MAQERAQERILITGAGSGLGRALAQRYAARGAAVCCADIRRDRAEETVALLGGGPHFAAEVDIASDESFAALREAVRARWDTLDVLVNNAGVSSGGGLLEAPMREWEWMLNVNLLGVVRGCRTFLPDLLAQGRGRIVNVASFAGLAGAPNIMTYGVAKAGVVTLSEQLRAEVAHKGIAVSVVCPSFFKTNLLENWGETGLRMKQFAQRLMDNAKESADDIAAAIIAQSERGTFLVLPTRAERLRWRLKRFLPEVYFRQLQKMARERGQSGH